MSLSELTLDVCSGSCRATSKDDVVFDIKVTVCLTI